MKNLFPILALLLSLILWSCGSPNTSTEEAVAVDVVEEITFETDTVSFGMPVTLDGAITVNELITQLDNNDSLVAKVIVEVDAVCKKKGCWMDVKGEETEEIVKVTFKDYEFFVPLDFDGNKAVIEGVAFRQITSVDELRHLAEDGGQIEEEIMSIIEPQEEIRFEAVGVTKLK